MRESSHDLKKLEYPFNYPHPLIFRYPKFTLLFFTFLLAYFFVTGTNFGVLRQYIFSLGHLGTFIAGAMYSYGFTAAPATAIFIILAKEQNIFLASAIGGLGSLVSDLLIFSFIRLSFNDEIEKLSRERFMMRISSFIPQKIKKYVVIAAAAIVIASPLPDEMGVVMLASYKSISAKLFSVLSYGLNTAGIFFILFVGTYL